MRQIRRHREAARAVTGIRQRSNASDRLRSKGHGRYSRRRGRQYMNDGATTRAGLLDPELTPTRSLANTAIDSRCRCNPSSNHQGHPMPDPATHDLKTDSAVFSGFGLAQLRSAEHTSELQSLMRILYAVLRLK